MVWQTFRSTLTRHYLDFTGRADRADFWRFALACLLAFGLMWLVTLAAGHVSHRVGYGLGLLTPLLAVALLPPLAGIGARRLHDVGQSGLLVGLFILPLLLSILAILHQNIGMPQFGVWPPFLYWSDFVAEAAFVMLASFWIQPRAIAQQTA